MPLAATQPSGLRAVRLLLLLEGTSFVVAGLVHRGVFVLGYEHHEASIAETVIGVVLLAGLSLTWILPARVRVLGLAAQAFALLGTLVGAFTIAIGVGPRTPPDVAFHVSILVVLIAGLVLVTRTRRYA